MQNMTPSDAFEEFELPTKDGTATTSWLVAPMSDLGDGLIAFLFDVDREWVCAMLGAEPDEISIVIWEEHYPFAISQDTGLSVRPTPDMEPVYCALPMIQGLKV
jgi:hypothetical protein